MHANDDSLSAYLDGEVDASEREEVESHLAGCADCRSRKDALVVAKEAVAGLARVEMTADEIRELRRAVGTRGSARRSPLWPRLAAAVGALGAVVIAFVSYNALRKESAPICSHPVQAASDAPTEFSSDAEVAAAVSSDTNITSKLGDCTVSDVGKSQEEAIGAFTSGSESAEQKDAGEIADAPAPTEADAGASRSVDFCLRERLRMIPKPTMPISARAVTYRGEKAWLLVYAYADTSEANDQLDLIQIWVVRQVDCEKDEAVLTVQSQHRPSP